MIKNLSDVPKSETFINFTKITAATGVSIIPVSIALENGVVVFSVKYQLCISVSTLVEHNLAQPTECRFFCPKI